MAGFSSSSIGSGLDLNGSITKPVVSGAESAATARVSGLVRELRGAWEEIAKDPSVVSDSRKVA